MTSLTAYNNDDTVIGWIRPTTSCEPGAGCFAHGDGKWHAIPRTGTLERYHFESLDDAVAAIS